MLKSCQYCGRIHDEKYICEQKKAVLERRKERQYKHTDRYEAYHHTTYWTKLSKYVRERDLYICQICGKPANEVHHIIKIEEDEKKAFEETNLISLCHRCHLMAEKGLITKDKLSEKVKESIEKYNERMGY